MAPSPRSPKKEKSPEEKIPTETPPDPSLVNLIQRLNKKGEEKENNPPKEEHPLPEKIYRVYNHSPQTVYIINADGTHTLLPRGHLDIPEAKISEHIKLMVRRGSVRLFERETPKEI